MIKVMTVGLHFQYFCMRRFDCLFAAPQELRAWVILSCSLAILIPVIIRLWSLRNVYSLVLPMVEKMSKGFSKNTTNETPLSTLWRQLFSSSILKTSLNAELSRAELTHPILSPYPVTVTVTHRENWKVRKTRSVGSAFCAAKGGLKSRRKRERTSQRAERIQGSTQGKERLRERRQFVTRGSWLYLAHMKLLSHVILQAGLPGYKTNCYEDSNLIYCQRWLK